MKKIILGALLLIFAIQSKAQQLVGFEYFFNTDPGIGQASFVAITPTSIYTGNHNFSTSSIPLGLNIFCVRFKDDSGRWSSVQSKQVINLDGNTRLDSIIGFEIFYDTEPGIGQGQYIAVNPTNEYNNTLNVIPASGVSGQKVVYVRAKNAAGLYSCYMADTSDISLRISDVAKMNALGFELFPNPASSNINLKVDNAYIGSFNLYIIDMNGKIVWQNKIHKTQSQQTFPITIPKIATGNYSLSIKSANNKINAASMVNIQQ